MMEVTELSQYVAVCLSSPLACCYPLVILRNWRIRFRSLLAIFLFLFVVAALSGLALFFLSGPNVLNRYLMGSIPALAYNIFFLSMERNHDGRTIFLLISIQLLHTMGMSICAAIVPYGSVAWILMLACLVSIICFLSWKFVRDPIYFFLESLKVGWLKLSAIPIALLICLYTGFVVPVTTDGLQASHDLSILLTCTASVIAYLGLWQSLNAMREYYAFQQDAALLSAQLDALEQQSAQISLSEQKNRVFRHDQRHFLQLLQASAAVEDMTSINHLLEHMSQELDKLDADMILHKYTGQPLLDTVLSLAIWRAREQNTEISIQMTLPQQWSVDVAAFSIMVSNALENALNACAQMPVGMPRQIRVQTHTTVKQFFFGLSNTYHGPADIDQLMRPYAPEHGYGSRSIASFVEKYGGILEYDSDGSWFHLKLLL